MSEHHLNGMPRGTLLPSCPRNDMPPTRPYVWRGDTGREAQVQAILAGIRADREADRLLADSFDSPWQQMPAGGRSWPSWRLKGCGTEAAYKRHLRKHEKPCAECTEANRLGKVKRRAAS